MDWQTLILQPVTYLLGGGIITWIYSQRAQRREHDKLMKELFKEFNERYNKLNDTLYEIKALGSKLNDLRSHEHGRRYVQALYDYLNLCAEEYFWHTKGRVDPKIWYSWQNGMFYWHQNIKALQELWQEELNEKYNGKSYYLNPGEDFFHSVN